jgi:hypothetical protein
MTAPLVRALSTVTRSSLSTMLSALIGTAMHGADRCPENIGGVDACSAKRKELRPSTPESLGSRRVWIRIYIQPSCKLNVADFCSGAYAPHLQGRRMHDGEQPSLGWRFLVGARLGAAAW